MRRPTKHHRKPKSLGGSDDTRNVSIVSQKRHEAWHTLFQNKTIHEIVRELNSVWIDPDWKIRVEAKEPFAPQQVLKFG